MIKNLSLFGVVVLFTIALITHFFLLGKIPSDPHGGGVIVDRFVSAAVSFLTLAVVYLLSFSLSRNQTIAFFSVFWLMTMPWHVEQSRVGSPVTPVTFVFICLIYLFLRIKNRLARLIALLVFLAMLHWIYSGFWIYREHIRLNDGLVILHNFFYLVSTQFLFFENHSFGIGSLRVYGVMLMETLPLFIIGLYDLVKTRNYRIILMGIGLPLLVASINPFFTGIEVYIATPIFAYILAVGLDRLISYAKKKSLATIILAVYSLILLYGITNFTHYYIVFYPFRITKEPNHEHKRF